MIPVLNRVIILYRILIPGRCHPLVRFLCTQYRVRNNRLEKHETFSETRVIQLKVKYSKMKFLQLNQDPGSPLSSILDLCFTNAHTYVGM